MSTYITVTSGTGALVNRVKQVQQANREAQLQRENDTALQAQATSDVAQQAAQTQRPIGGNPDTSIERRPAAQRQAGFGLLFQCVFIDAPGTTWSDGTVLDPFTSAVVRELGWPVTGEAAEPSMRSLVQVMLDVWQR